MSADQRVTFYELIKNKARGKSGPLFKFDVHDDVRMYSDVRVEKDEVRRLFVDLVCGEKCVVVVVVVKDPRWKNCRTEVVRTK